MAIYHILAAFRKDLGFQNSADHEKGRLTLELDALVSQEPSYEAEVTQAAIESGAIISDHVSLKPLTLSVEGVVTSNPADFARIAQMVRLKDVVGDARAALVKLFEDRLPFFFVGGPSKLETYHNMVITQLSFPSRVGTGKALVINCRMQQVKIVEAKGIQLERIAKADYARAAPVADMGFQPTGTFQNITTTQKVMNADITKFLQKGGSYPLPKNLVPKGIGAKLPGVP
jgi:hypothetical protein